MNRETSSDDFDWTVFFVYFVFAFGYLCRLSLRCCVPVTCMNVAIEHVLACVVASRRNHANSVEHVAPYNNPRFNASHYMPVQYVLCE